MEERNKEALMALEKERLAYMVDWRNRHIEKLQERLAGREEVNNMLQTLLFYALTKAAEQQGEGVLCHNGSRITYYIGNRNSTFFTIFNVDVIVTGGGFTNEF